MEGVKESSLEEVEVQTKSIINSEIMMQNSPHLPFICMEELLEKLKLLGYEKGFCGKLRLKPISRHYFALTTNPGEQFHYFVSLAALLIGMNGRTMASPRESDDPNAVIAVILDNLRQMGNKLDFAPSKLKTGCGKECIWVLDSLASCALREKDLVYNRPVYPEEESGDVEHLEIMSGINVTDACLDICDIEEEFEDNCLGVDELTSLCQSRDEATKTMSGSEDMSVRRGVLESNTDAMEWNLELERVLPYLKLTGQSDNKDWRDHAERLIHYSSAVESSMQELRGQMNGIRDNITRTMEKIGARERYVGEQLKFTLAEYCSVMCKLTNAKSDYRQSSHGLVDKSSFLAEISEMLERVKHDMEERGTAMTDGVPLLSIKKAIARIHVETLQMEARISLLQHELLRQSMIKL